MSIWCLGGRGFVSNLIIQFRSICLKFSEPRCCFEILPHQDSSIPACYLVTLFQKFDMNTSWFNTENNLWVSMQNNLIIKNTVKQKPLYLFIMYKPVKCKTKISVLQATHPIWLWQNIKSNLSAISMIEVSSGNLMLNFTDIWVDISCGFFEEVYKC